MIDLKKLAIEILSEALIHKISDDGEYVGAYEYKHGDPNKGVQGVTLHKDSIEKYFPKLLDDLPDNFKGKKPIGVIGSDYADTRDIKDLQGKSIRDPNVSEIDWNEKKTKSSEEIAAAKELEKEKRQQAKGATFGKRVTPKQVKDLANYFYNGPEHVDDLAKTPAFRHSVDAYKNIFGTDVEGLKKIVAAAHLASKTKGPRWAEMVANRYNPKEQKEPVTKEKESKKPEENIPTSELEQLPKHALGLGHQTYTHGKKVHTLDKDYLANNLSKMSQMPIEYIDQKNPKLAKELQNNLGSHWQGILYLARNAQTALAMGKDKETWLKSLEKNPILSATNLDELPEIDQIADSVYSSVEASKNIPKPAPTPSQPDAHYHDKTGKPVDFSSEDVNKVLADIGTSSPYELLYDKPDKVKQLKDLFGPNWGVLISVAQRINKHKANGNPNPVETAKEEYKGALSNSLGKDWETSFQKIAGALSAKTQMSHKDQSLNKKDAELAKLDASYNADQQVFTPDLKYLRDIALPALVDKLDSHIVHIDETDPQLSNDLQSKLGPSWFHILTIAKKAQQDATKGHDPYKTLLVSLEQNPTYQALLQKQLGASYMPIAANVIQATTGIKPPSSLDTSKLVQYQAQTQPDLEVQPGGSEVPTSQMDAITQQDLEVQPGGSETPTTELPTVTPDTENIPTNQAIPTLPNAEVATNVAAPAVTQQDLPTTNEVPTNQMQAVTQNNIPAQPEANPQEYPAIPSPEETPTTQMGAVTQQDMPVQAQQPAEPEQPETPPIPEVPKPQPITGGGSVPQSKQTNIDVSSLPKDVLHYVNDGVVTEIRPDQIQRLLQMNLTPEEEDTNPAIKSQLAQTFGKEWKSISEYVRDIKDNILKHNMTPENLKWYYKGILSHPKKLEKTQEQFGGNWEKFLEDLINSVSSAMSSQGGETQQDIPTQA